MPRDSVGKRGIRLPPAKHDRSGSQPRTSTERYVDELLRQTGGYARPAREARAIIDKSTGSLTDALYELRRDGAE
jgi:hypothetical protein